MGQKAQTKTVIVYSRDDGKEPFTEWLYDLRDAIGRRQVLNRVSRLEYGLYGDYKQVGEGVLELRIFVGAGYRVYFGEDKGNLIVLLCGGDKSSQKKDILKAQEYWKDYQENV